MKKIKILLTCIVVGLFIIAAGGSDSDSSSNTSSESSTSLGNDDTSDTSNSSSQNNEKFQVGELAYLTDNCVGVVDDDDMSEVLNFVKANDESGIREMVAAKKATTFAAGKQVKIVKIGLELIQVRDIDSSEMLVWVPGNMLTHEDIYGIYTK